jgi:hypothetical protein
LRCKTAWRVQRRGLRAVERQFGAPPLRHGKLPVIDEGVARWAALPSLTGTPLQLNVGGRSHDSSVNSYHKDYWLREELSTNNAFPPLQR